MSNYRLYFRDYEGHFCGCRQFEAPDEALAIERADRMCCDCSRELWSESGLLRQWGGGVPDSGMTEQATILSNDRLRPPGMRSQR